jgi:hypothetical protein
MVVLGSANESSKDGEGHPQLSPQDQAWFYSFFQAMSANKSDNEWQAFVTDLMSARHGGSFFQVDATGRGDKGCDGWIGGLMLACYGAISVDQRRVSNKITGDFSTACAYWERQMRRWAFVHNNKRGLAEAVHRTIVELSMRELEHGVKVENWPPQVLWDETCAHLARQQLVRIIGAPPSDHPAGLTYVGRCVEALARTPSRVELGAVPPVPFGKIAANGFSAEVTSLLMTYQTYTERVRFYFSRAKPGEQVQVSDNLRMRYDGLRARLVDSDAVFHALCEDLRAEAFGGIPVDDPNEEQEQRSAALMVVTHFFEKCTVFEPAEVETA